MPSTTDLRELLSSDAEHVSSTRFPVEQVIERGRQARLRRRVVTVAGACVTVGAVALPIALSQTAGVLQQPTGGRPIAPADARPAIPPAGGWVPDLPGVDLPLGDSLATPYAIGSTLVVQGSPHDVGAQIVRVLDVPEGTVVITSRPDEIGALERRLELVRDEGSTVTIDSGVITTAQALIEPAGATRLAWLWRGADDDPTSELRSVVLGGAQPMSSVAGEFNLILGSLDGAVLVSTMENESAVPDLARWEPGTDVVEPVASDPGDGSFILGVTGVNRNTDRALMYTGEVPQCNYAAPITDLGGKLWEQCEGGPLVPAPSGSLAANQAGVVDIATGAFVARFQLGSDRLLHWAQGPDTGGIGVEIAGWSADDVLIRLTSTDGIATTPAPGGAVTYNPAYVGVRCSASTGTCQRLPHAIDAVDGATH